VAGGRGRRIERVDLNHRAPPLNLRRRFNAVANARSEGRKARADAESERAKMLNEVAGNAAPSLIEAIDRYEAAIETADGTADGVLSRIDSIMANEDSAGAPLASGAVSEIMSRAENLRFATASNAEADAKLFTAKLDQFRASPALMYRRDRDDALSTFLGKRFVQSVVLPVGGDAQLIINEDPDIQRDLDLQRYKSQAEQAIEDRERARRLDRYQTQRGIQREEN
ncbi:MAG: hypothetical protein CMJ31_08700, partial [Phycisphaerae bacterium]|nr:hypothetical protein [Phycisphaerae bacterium]